jgi:PAS domain-containing protein
LGLTALVFVAEGVYAWLQRSRAGGGWFNLLAAGGVVWALAAAFEAAAREPAVQLFFAKATHIGLASVPPIFVLFAFRFSGHRERVSPGFAAFLCAAPALTLAMVFTNDLHHFFWTRVAPLWPSGRLEFTFGPGYWLFLLYCSVMTLAGSFLLCWESLANRRLYKSQAVLALTGIAVAWLGALSSFFPGRPLSGLDLGPVGLAAAGVLFSAGLAQMRLADAIPIARDKLIDEIEDALVVIDVRGKLVDANPAARKLLRIDEPRLGRPASQVLPALLAPRPEDGEKETVAEIPGLQGRVFELRVSRLYGLQGEPAGRMIMLRDITDRRKDEGERERLLGELRDAVAHIKTLSGLLPICSSCKRIRGEDGSWQVLERFVMDHSQAAFSHGLCPECLSRMESEVHGISPVSGQAPRKPDRDA